MSQHKKIAARLLVVLAICLISVQLFSQNEDNGSKYDIERFSCNRYKMAHANAEKATTYFKEGASYFLNHHDTVNYLNCIAHLSDIEHRQGRFSEAFDLLWEALPLATKIENRLPLLEFHQMLGILYQVYGKDSIALYHTKAGLQISKEYAKINEKQKTRMLSCYLDVAIQYVAMEKYESALQYLDSSYSANNSHERLYFVDAIYGQIYLEQKKYTQAQKYLNGVIPFLESKGNGFQTSVNHFMGQLKSKINQSDSAIFYFEKSLLAIDSLQHNLKLKPEVLEHIANEYALIGDGKKAFKYMQEAKLLSDSLFHTQSQQNQSLFEIKNRYRDDLKQKEEQLATQNQLLALSNKARFRLQLLLAILILLIVITFIAIGYKSKTKRLAFERDLNEEKNKAILETKNKELTANALQIIEKEHELREMLEILKEKDPDQYQKLYRKTKKKNKKIWDDFHLRVTQTNDQFYANLLKLHPDLTPTDLKHCALIKLNFDSKEMSYLLGISLNSVHMARSRIRKKLNLNRNDSLSNYLTQV